MAEQFAGVLRSMWKGTFSVSPSGFKKFIGKINEQWDNREQQDSQEFLSFLLDGIHEDLNLVLKKPYFERPDSEGRLDEDLMLQSFMQHLCRNQSFVQFVFGGMMRS